MMKGMFSASSVHRKIILALVLIGLVFGSSSAEAKRPNIVFIFSDDHAVQAIGAYGSKINTTPNIDRLAKEGAIFENSFCANSICGPSRANILTGKHSHINGFLRNGNRFDGGQPTFPKCCKELVIKRLLLANGIFLRTQLVLTTGKFYLVRGVIIIRTLSRWMASVSATPVIAQISSRREHLIG